MDDDDETTTTMDLAAFVEAYMPTTNRWAVGARTDATQSLAQYGAVQTASWYMEELIKADTTLNLMKTAAILADRDITPEMRAVEMAKAVARVMASTGRSSSDFTSAAQASAARQLAGLMLGLGLLDARTFAARLVS